MKAQFTRNALLASAAAAGFAAGALAMPPATTGADAASSCCRASRLVECSAYYENILGTSMQMILHANSQRHADWVEMQLLREIDRLSGILSTYSPASEISRHMNGAPVSSNELAQVMEAYEMWGGRTGGAIDIHMARVKEVWKRAARENELPCDDELACAQREPGCLNVDALGKGYIIDRVVELARTLAPAGLLNIGGDMRAWGSADFTIAIADPFNPAENAAPLASLVLRDAAIATSGDYARFFTIAGVRYSHILDPRTNRPAKGVASASVVAGDCLTANALSTAACVLDCDESANLANQYGRGYLLVDEAGGATCGGSLGDSMAPSAQALAAAEKSDWPKDYQVAINLELKVPRGRAKRPYVAVWIEDAKGKAVRTVAFWGNQQKYLREMSDWWQANKGDRDLLKATSRGTREPGKYVVVWDGMDDAGKPLPKGDYKVVVEINREHGRHVTEVTAINCGDKKVSAVLKGTAESEESEIVYAARETKAKETKTK